MVLSPYTDNTAFCSLPSFPFLSLFRIWAGFPGPIRGLDWERLVSSLRVLSALNEQPDIKGNHSTAAEVGEGG